MTQILLVDDHALFRASLSRLLADHPDLRVTGQCATVEEAIQLMESNTYDLVLLDYELGDRRGIDVAQAAKRIGFTGKILLVTVGLTPTEVRHLLNLGISGIFLKNSSPEELLDAIRSVCAGGNWMDPKYQQQVEASAAAGLSSRAKFTERDRHVLKGVFEGLANKEIAEQLGVSESAIKASLQQLFGKTGVRTRGQLVRVALEHYRRELL